MTDPSLIDRRLAAELARLRVRRGWTQRQLAGVLGCASSTVALWEMAQRAVSVRRLVQIAAALGADPADILRVAATGPEVARA